MAPKVGQEIRNHQRVSPRSRRHRFPRSPSRIAIRTDHPAFRALRRPRKRSSFAPRFTEDGKPAAQVAGLSQTSRPRPLSGSDRPSRIETLIQVLFLSEPAHPALSRFGLTRRHDALPIPAARTPFCQGTVTVKVIRTFKYGAHDVTIETGAIARQADGAVVVNMADTVVLVTAVGEKKDVAGPRLLPADRQLSGKDLRGRAHSGRLLQARRPAERERNVDVSAHRPADPPVVPGRFPTRSAGHRDRAVHEPRDRSRRSVAARRVGGARAVGPAVSGPDRRRPRRLQRRSSIC